MSTRISPLPQLGQWKDLQELTELQDKLLPEALGRAARSPFYAARFGHGPPPTDRTDLSALALTSKQDLRDNYPFGLLAVPSEELATYHESSGTAGQPTPSYYTQEDWTDLAERYARKWIGISATDTFLVRTPYALMITGHLAHAAARLRGATVIPGDNRSLAMPYSRVVRVLHDLGVTLTWSMPTETLLWAAAARAQGLDPGTDFPALRALFVGGEPLSESRRLRISRLWNVPVIQEYGSTETGSLAGECPHGRMHLWADRMLFEVRDLATGRMSAEGAGNLVVTPLFHAAMPLVRYDLGDYVEVAYSDCACGWELPTVRVFGRAASAYQVGAGQVTQHQIEELVFGLDQRFGVLFWRGRAERQRLLIQIEVSDAHAVAATAALIAAVRSSSGLECEVESVTPGTLVPDEVLTGLSDVVKPRSLFGPEEDWDKALLYY